MPEHRRHVHDETKEALQLISNEASQVIGVSAADVEQAWHRRPAFGWDEASTAEMAPKLLVGPPRYPLEQSVLFCSAPDVQQAWNRRLDLGWARASTAEAASELLVGPPRYPMEQSESPAHRSRVL